MQWYQQQIKGQQNCKIVLQFICLNFFKLKTFLISARQTKQYTKCIYDKIANIELTPPAPIFKIEHILLKYLKQKYKNTYIINKNASIQKFCSAIYNFELRCASNYVWSRNIPADLCYIC